MYRLTALILLLSPVFLIVAIAIILEDRFPVFFAHRRGGINYTFFKICKFRIMQNNTPNDATVKRITAGIIRVYLVKE